METGVVKHGCDVIATEGCISDVIFYISKAQKSKIFSS